MPMTHNKMKKTEYAITANVWLYQGAGAWHFVTIPKNISDEIKVRYSDLIRGWGSLRVRVTVGQTHWATSIFFDKESSCYILPIKIAVRKAEGIVLDRDVSFILELVV